MPFLETVAAVPAAATAEAASERAGAAQTARPLAGQRGRRLFKS